jgi:hypothetical protein
MAGKRLTQFENVVSMIVNRMVPPERKAKATSPRDGEAKKKGRVVFLLGAGCSRQYGLPNFRELLSYIWQERLRRAPDPSWSLETLRDELDKHWQSLGPEDRHDILASYLGNRVKGDICLGYLRLAEIAKAGYVKAIVNMNFDTLLEEALRKKGCKFRVATSFHDHPDREHPYRGLIIYKPHGSIGTIHFGNRFGQYPLNKPRNELILDIANSDLFADPSEQSFAQKLFNRHDVVILGYSGIDAKMAAALRGHYDTTKTTETTKPTDTTSPTDPRNTKVFFINMAPPDPRLALVMAEHLSQNLSLVGEDAAFENFMEDLHDYIQWAEEGNPPKASQVSASAVDTGNPMTRAERKALDQCLEFALGIRTAINVADRSPLGIAEHGREVYTKCLDLAGISGNCLTSPEKYLLYCAAYLHDLGYFTAFSGGAAIGGLTLLESHGGKSADIISQQLEDSSTLADVIFPSSYDAESKETLKSMLTELCRFHAAAKLSNGHNPESIKISGVDIPVRFGLLHALFSVAEQIVKEHPFLPSADAVTGRQERFSIDDPVLNLYLRKKKNAVGFTLEKGKIIGHASRPKRDEPPSRVSVWLLTMASRFISNLNQLSLDNSGWGVKFVCDPPEALSTETPHGESSPLLIDALEEDFKETLEQVQHDKLYDSVGLLDNALGLLGEITKSRAGDDPLYLMANAVHWWVGYIVRSIRQNFLADAERKLWKIDGVLKSFDDHPIEDLAKEVRFARSDVGKLLDYVKENKPTATSDAFSNTVNLSLELLSHVAKSTERPAHDSTRQSIEKVIAYLSHFKPNPEQLSMGEVGAILDLTSIYTMKIDNEPRVPFDREPVQQALDWAKGEMTHQGLLHIYLPIKQSMEAHNEAAEFYGQMGKVFVKSFEDIIYPAWRFFARNWHGRSEAVLMARACLDLGSSRFRGEVVEGLKYLLGERVEEDEPSPPGAAKTMYGHDRCTICTSRLLYIFSYARRIFPRDELGSLAKNQKKRGLDETVGGILSYMLSIPEDSNVWWGVGAKGGGVRSADYLAWAARAVAFCLSIDHEIHDKVGEKWLEEKCGVDMQRLNRLLSQRWEQLLSVKENDLLSGLAEEPQSFTLGRVALAYLDLLRLEKVITNTVLNEPSSSIATFIALLDKVGQAVERGSTAQMSSYYMMPIMIAKDSITQGDDAKKQSAENLLDVAYRCLTSPIWIRSGPDRGSWGFNVKNTQAIVTALAAFWRYAFDPEHRERFQAVFERYTP